jgi:uncharacterized protein (DUF885 family)
MHLMGWKSVAFCAGLLLVMTPNVHGQTGDLAARRHALDQLLDEQWQYTLRETPELATVIGDYRYNDRLSDASLAHVEQQRKDTEAFLKRFEAIDTSGFPEQELLNQQLMVRNLKENLEANSLKLYLMPEDQFGGLHLQLAQFVPLIPFDTAKQYEDYIARLHQMPRVIDQVIETLEQGRRDKMMPPKFLLEKVVS